MKLAISLLTAVSLGLTCTALADNCSTLVAQGYRWVTVHGPYASSTEQGVQRITAHHGDAAELEMVENGQAYYLIPGTIVQVVEEDPDNRMSQVRWGGLTTSLWTYTRFLSKHPIRDTYGNIETPENSGLMPSVDTAIIPTLPNKSAARTRQNGTP
jgi:hypothetical protein